MVRLKKLTLTNFRSFVSPCVVEFSDHGLTCLRGFNLDTGGSSGAGKSNVAYAIAYALGYCPYPAASLQSNYSSEPMQVDLELVTDEGVVMVRRGEVNCVKTPTKKITSAKAIQEKIKEVVGLPLDFLSALTFHQQQEKGVFLSMNDGEKKEFLSQLLGLEEIEEQIESANKTIKEVEVKCSVVDNTIKVLKDVLVEPKHAKLLTDELALDVVRSAKEEVAQANKMVKGWTELLHKYSDELYQKQTALESVQLNETEALKTKQEAIRANRLPPDVSVKSKDEIELEEAYDSARQRIAVAEEELEKLREDFDQKIFDTNKEYERLRGVAEEAEDLEEQADKLNQKIKKVSKNVCPTCSQPWQDSQIQEAEWRNEAQALIAKIELAKEASVKASRLYKEIDRLHEEARRANDQKATECQALSNILHPIYEQYQNCKNIRTKVLDRFESDCKIQDLEFEAELTSLNQKHRNQLDVLKREYEINAVSAESEYRTALDKFHKAETELALAEAELHKVKEVNDAELKRFQDNQTQYQNTLSQLKDLENSQKEYHSKLEAEEAFVGVLKGFLGAIFDEVLAEISNEVNELLKTVPNVATTTVQFTSEKVTQKGVVKPEIRPVITKNGNSVPLKAGLSGGQFTSVDLAVDLAVGIVISRRTNKTPGWLILDESFEGHDVPVKEACLQMLRKASENRLIIIVDHTSEIKEMFDRFIDIESKNDISRVK